MSKNKQNKQNKQNISSNEESSNEESSISSINDDKFLTHSAVKLCVGCVFSRLWLNKK